jgi:hypothetical protein
MNERRLLENQGTDRTARKILPKENESVMIAISQGIAA